MKKTLWKMEHSQIPHVSLSTMFQKFLLQNYENFQ